VGLFQNTASKDIDHDGGQVYDSLIGEIYSQKLWAAVIAQYNNVMDVVQFVIVFYFPYLGLNYFSLRVISWIPGSFGFPG